MSLRVKILIILVVVISSYALAEHTIRRLVIFPSFEALEQEEARQDLKHCLRALGREVESLAATCRDAAAWDETYRLLLDGLASSRQSRLLSTALRSNNLSLIYVYGPRGEVAWGGMGDPGTGQPIQGKSPAGGPLDPNNLLLALQAGSAGVLVSERGPLLVASSPIPGKDEVGPGRGTLVMGRLLGPEAVRRLAEQTQLTFQVWPISGPGLPAEEKGIPSRLKPGEPLLVSEGGPKLLKAYAAFPDLRGRPALLVRADLPRDITARGAAVLRIARIALLSAGVMMMIPLLILVWRMVVAEGALRVSEERHRTVLEASPDPVVVCDPEGRATYINPAFSQVFGWTPAECLGQDMNFLPRGDWINDPTVMDRLRSGQTVSGIEGLRPTRDERLIDVSLSAAAFFDAEARLKGYVVTLQDITERKRTEEQLKFLAYHDPLTGLPNRKSFYERLEDRLSQSRRQPTSRWALLFLDLDHFKDVNDALGHDVGDELLKAVSSRIEECLRTTDYVFRVGGDEFTIMTTNLTRGIDAAKVARRVLETVADPFHILGHKLHVTGSIGISVHPEDGDSLEILVKNADLAMYAAKKDRNSYLFFTEDMNRQTLERLKLERGLCQATLENQLELYYQPLVNNQRRIVGTEALLRWNHPELGCLLPDQFIPLADETGAIVGIGEWILATACRQAKKWQDQGHEGFYVAVNLSARQFKQPDLIETVERVLEETGLPAECLQLELSETCVMDDPEEAVVKMRRLHRRGVRFSIDDFGAGRSSLSYLNRFPADTLKIDRSFIREAASNSEDQEVIRTIISMARHLSMEPLAKGVESQEQREFLSSNGCGLVQGYCTGPPMVEAEFERLLRRQKPARKD